MGAAPTAPDRGAGIDRRSRRLILLPLRDLFALVRGEVRFPLRLGFTFRSPVEEGGLALLDLLRELRLSIQSGA